MPLFPRYESKEKLTTQQPSALMPLDTTGESITKVGETFGKMADTTEKWANAIQSTRNTRSLVNYKSSSIGIASEAEVEVDPSKKQSYFDRLKAERDKNAVGLSPDAVLELGLEAKTDAIKMESMFRKKEIGIDNVATKEYVAQQVRSATKDSMPNIKNRLSEKVALGFFTPEEAYDIEVQANKDLGVNSVSNAIYAAKTPEDIDVVSQSFTSGAYEQGGVTINPVEKKNLLDVIDRAKENLKKKQEAAFAESITQNRVNTALSISNGEEVDLNAIAQIDPELSMTIRSTKDFLVNYNPKQPMTGQLNPPAGTTSVTQIEKFNAYADSIVNVFNQDDNVQLGKYLLQELRKKGDGLTPSIKTAAFINLAFLKSKANNPQSAEDLAHASRYAGIKNAISYLKTGNQFLTSESIGNFLVRNFLSGRTKPSEIMEEAKEVKKNSILGNPRYASAAKLPSMPNKIVDGNAPVEDLQDGENDLMGEKYSGNYGDASSD